MKSSQSLTGILKSLKRNEVLWEEKVRLIHKILSNGAFLPNKHQILLDWTSQELINHAAKGGDMMQQLWEILVEILRQSRQKNRSRKSFLTLRPGIVEAFIKSFSNKECYCMSLVECCTMVFEWPEVCKPLTAKFEKFVILISNVLDCLTQNLREISDSKEDIEPKLRLVDGIIHLVGVLLQVYRRLEKQQSDFQMVFVFLCEHLLRQIATFKHFASKFRHGNCIEGVNVRTSVNNTTKLISDIRTLFKTLMWTRETLEGIKKSLDFSKDKHAAVRENDRLKKKVACLDSFISSIQSCLKVADGESEIFVSILEFIPDVFQTLVEANREIKALQNKQEFSFFKKLQQTISDDCFCSKTPANLESLVKFSADLLAILVNFNIFKVNDEAINSEENASFLGLIAKDAASLLNSEQDHDVRFEVYRCFQYLLKINSSLVTPHITTLVKELIVQSPTYSQVGLAQKKEELFNCFLERYAKMRQIEKFLQLLVQAIDEVAPSSKFGIPETSFNRLIEISNTLPIGQSLSVVEMLLNVMNSFVKSLSDGKLTDNRSVESQIAKLTKISSIYEIFMVHLNILPHGGHLVANQDKYVHVLRMFQERIIQPLLVVFNSSPTNGDLKYRMDDLVWKFVAISEKVELFLLQHDVIPFEAVQTLEMLHRLLKVDDKEPGYRPLLDMNHRIARATAMIFGLKTSMLIGNDLGIQTCLKDLEKTLATSLRDPSKTLLDDDRVLMNDYLEIFMKELPWLGNHLGSEAILRLNQLLYECLESCQSGEDESSQKHRSIYEDLRFVQPVLSSAHFYDNLRMQEEFCNLLAVKLRLLTNTKDSSDLMVKLNATREMNSKRTEYERNVVLSGDGNGNDQDNGESDDDDDDEEDKVDAMDYEDGIGNTAASQTMDNSTSGVEHLLSEEDKHQYGLLLQDFLKFPLKTVYIRQSTSDSSEFHKNLILCLQTIRSLHCKWLLPNCKIQLLFQNLLVIRELLIHRKKSKQQLSALALALSVIPKLALSNDSHRPCITWKAINPASLLSWLLTIIQQCDYQDELPVDEICMAINCLFTLTLKTKQQASEILVIDEIANKVLQICEMSIKGTSALQPRIINSFLSSAFETLKSPAKKHSLITATTIIHPTVKLVLSVEPVACDNSIDSDTDKNTWLKLRSYAYTLAICMAMKSSRKHAHLVALQEELKWQNRFTVFLDILKRELTGLRKRNSPEERSTSAEKVCVDCLALFYSLEDHDEDSELRNLEFARGVFVEILELAEASYKENRDRIFCNLIYKVMLAILNQLSEVNQENLFNDVVEKLKSSLEDVCCVAVCLDFINSVFCLKRTKEKQQTMKNALPAVIYLCIKVISTEPTCADEYTSLIAYNIITKALGFSKGTIQNYHCIATLHLLALKTKAPQTRSFEMFTAKVNLLSNLLFNHPDAVYPAISSFLVAVQALLSDLSMLYDASQTKPADIIKQKQNKIEITRACEKLSRFYQEISNHKQAIKKYAPHMIASFLKMAATSSIAEEYQNYIIPGIHSIMDTCSENEFAMLNMHLSQGDREMFKELHKEYNKHYKFQGKA